MSCCWTVVDDIDVKPLFTVYDAHTCVHIFIYKSSQVKYTVLDNWTTAYTKNIFIENKNQTYIKNDCNITTPSIQRHP